MTVTWKMFGLAPVERLYTVTFLDHEAVHVSFKNVWLHNEKIILFSCYSVLVLNKFNRGLFIGNEFSFRACLHEGGGPKLGEVTCGGSLHLSIM